MTDPYMTAARAEILAKGEFAADHLLFDQLVHARAGIPWFRAAIDAAIQADRAGRADRVFADISRQTPAA